ncbi:MAG: glycosyltransferase family 2 protein [Bacilli bacterium]|nr:glycosyltransferase family 2 protein [Bacilli bacterium]
MKKILLIIPSYNEEDNVLNNYQKIIDYNKKNKTNYDAIVINDGSSDKTEEICIKNNIPHISLIHNLGIGGAVQTGYKYALDNNYEIAIQFDGDGQHDVSYVKDIILPITKENANMVIGSRFIDKSSSNFQSSSARRVGIKIISFFIKLITGKKIYDTTSGFRAIDKKLIKEFAYDYPVEYPEPVSTTKILKDGYKVKEVAVSMNERENGISSIRAWKNIYYMINVVLSIIIIGLGGRKK